MLRDQLVDQRIVTKTAEAAYINARLDREVAEIAVREYVEGDYVVQLADVEGDIKIAEAELALAELELKVEKSAKPSDPSSIKRAELALLRAGISLEKAQSRKKCWSLHPGQEDQGAGIRGQEGPCRRAGQGGGLLADDSERTKPGEADLQLDDHRPDGWPGPIRVLSRRKKLG